MSVVSVACGYIAEDRAPRHRLGRAFGRLGDVADKFTNGAGGPCAGMFVRGLGGRQRPRERDSSHAADSGGAPWKLCARALDGANNNAPKTQTIEAISDPNDLADFPFGHSSR